MNTAGFADVASGRKLMFQKIVVPLDGSELAEKALPYARYLAAAEGGALFLIRAVEVWAATVQDALENGLEKKPQAEAELAAAAARIAGKGVAVEHAVYVGEPAGAIELAASTHKADLIVMSSHGRSGFARWAYGSVAERVLRGSALPVLVVPAHTDVAWQAREQSIVVPLDGSRFAEEAIEPAKLLSRALNASMILLQVVEPLNPTYAATGMGMGYYPAFDLEAWVDDARPYAEGIAEQLRAAGFAATAETTGGYAASTIQRVAADRQAAAIVMASHGRTGLARLALGSVAVGVVQRASAPVLIVRPAAMKPPEGPAGDKEQVTA
jgi:nucleotide-binding universal stress UspA family protein